MTAIDALADEIAALEVSLGGARTMAAAFDGELQGMRASLAGTARESARLSDGMGRGLRRAFDGIALNDHARLEASHVDLPDLGLVIHAELPNDPDKAVWSAPHPRG